MPTGAQLPAEKLANRAYRAASHMLDTGKVHVKLQDLAKGDERVTHDVFERGTSRKKIFLDVLRHDAEYGLEKGARFGLTLTQIPEHLITGTGKERNETPKLKDEGAVGHTVKALQAGCSGLIELSGNIVGGAAGVITLPFSIKSDISGSEWVKNTSKSAGFLAAKVTANTLGAITGGAMFLTRIPTTASKVICTGIGGLLGCVVGFLRASGRAILGN